MAFPKSTLSDMSPPRRGCRNIHNFIEKVLTSINTCFINRSVDRNQHKNYLIGVLRLHEMNHPGSSAAIHRGGGSR